MSSIDAFWQHSLHGKCQGQSSLDVVLRTLFLGVSQNLKPPPIAGIAYIVPITASIIILLAIVYSTEVLRRLKSLF